MKKVVFILFATLMMLGSCSIKKNTGMTRFYHSLTARYNIMYNGELAFIDAHDAQVEGNKDDYTQLLPMYISMNKATAKIGSSNYDKAILKAEKAIKLHSIKRKPTVKPGKKRTPELKQYLARKEYNPYIWRSWLMLGESQFGKGEFIEASSTFNYMIRLYAAQPQISAIAKAWLARCYVAMEWPYDAEDVLRRMEKDSLGTRATRSYESSRAAWLIQTGQYVDAIPLLRRTIEHQKGRVEKARLNYLLGQLYRETGEPQKAYKAMSRVIHANPPYEMALSARVLQSEVMSKGHSTQIIKKLQRMAKSDNNRDYTDQIYLAIGNIWMTVPDTLHAIWAWEKGLTESKGGSAKTQLDLRLAEIYWQKENYIDAARCYKEALGSLDKEKSNYLEIKNRSDALEPIAPYLEQVKLQDSLQALAKLTKEEQISVADRLIKELKKKEKEEAKRQDADQLAKTRESNMQASQAKNGTTPGQRASSQSQKSTTWYFDNTATVTKGKESFIKKWGNRRNEDNWLWSDRSYFQTNGSVDANIEPSDSTDYSDDTVGEEEIDEEEQARIDSLANDPHHREYYLKQIPNTEEQMEESNKILSEGLYNAGVLEQDKLGNYPLAYRTLSRLMKDFPDYEKMDDALYHMVLISGKLGYETEAVAYRDTLISRYPDSNMAKLLSNPQYDMIARGGKHLEDSVYSDTYNAYLDGNYSKVNDNYQFSSDNYPEGKHRSRFMFVHAMSQLYSGDRKGFLASLKELVDKYSSDELGKLAAEIMKGVSEGRLLQNDRMDMSGIWSMRTKGGAEGDSTQVAQLSDAKITGYNFVLAYQKGSLDEDQLLFEIARYNFTSFMVRNFDLEISDLGNISMLVVKGFLNFDEVHAYAQQLYSNRHMAIVLEGIRSVLISDENLKLLGVDFSFDEYKQYYDEHFAPIEVPKDLQIDEDQIIENEDEEDASPVERTDNEENKSGEVDSVDDDDFPFGY